MLETTAARQQARIVLERLAESYPEPFDTALDHDADWQLLFSVLLSAQTTDENVNRVAATLYATLPSVEAIARAPIEELERLVYSTGYYKAKARRLQACAQALLDEHQGIVPTTIDELITLPGVGRKTANVVFHVLGHPPAGVVMDTHISRVTMRLGLTDSKDPLKAEARMMELLEPKDWKAWGDLLIQHGRSTCHARRPRCESCVLSDICPSAEVPQ